MDMMCWFEMIGWRVCFDVDRCACWTRQYTVCQASDVYTYRYNCRKHIISLNFRKKRRKEGGKAAVRAMSMTRDRLLVATDAI